VKRISLAPKPSASMGGARAHGYTELRSIGRGSFGEAFLVQDRDGQHFVMKTVDIGNLEIEQQRDAVNEVKVLASLKHPYIVRYHESFINCGTLSIVMDYAEGGDLANRINKNSRLHQFFGEAQILRWLAQLALGLKYLHSAHIIHRDLKPQNLFLAKKDDLRIGDFGISKMLGSKRKAVVDQTIGTPYYLSPEICQERLYSAASDMWSLGCIVFELTALHVPFEAQNISALIKRITSGVVPEVAQAYSADLRHVVSSLLCQDHKRRPSAVDLVQGAMVQDEMRKMLGGLPTSSPAPSRPQSAFPTNRPESPRPTSAARPLSQRCASPRSAARPSSQHSPSPRCALRQSANNLMSTPNIRPKEAMQAPLSRPLSAAPSDRGGLLCQRARDGAPRDGPFSRPLSAAPGAGPLSRPMSAFGVKGRDDSTSQNLLSGHQIHCRRPPPSGRPRSAAPTGQRRSYAFAGG